MVRRDRGSGSSRGRAEGRVRDRVRGRTGRRVGRAGRSRGNFDVRDVEGYVNRLRDHVENNPRSGGTASGLGGVASGLAGAASGLAGGSLAHRLQGSDTEGSEDFIAEVRERLDLIEGRLAQLEDEMSSLIEAEIPADLEEPGNEPDPYSGR